MRFGNGGVVVENGSNVISGNFGQTEVVDRPTETTDTPAERRVRWSTPDFVAGTQNSDTRFAKDGAIYDGELNHFWDSRKNAWEGLGTEVKSAMTAEEALRLGRLNYTVLSEDVFDQYGKVIPHYHAMVRDSDRAVLGMNGDRYKILQNKDAFAWIDELVGSDGLQYQVVGQYHDGSRVWIVGKLPKEYDILGDKTDCYLTFLNSFDGSSSVKVMMSPVRVICNNMISLCTKEARQSWSCRHTRSIDGRLAEARETLQLSEVYMENLKKEFEGLYQIKVDKDKVIELNKILIPDTESMSERQQRNVELTRSDIFRRFTEAPDLKDREMTGARYIQAVADTATHMNPIRKTENYNENRFARLLDGRNLVNKAYEILVA